MNAGSLYGEPTACSGGQRSPKSLSGRIEALGRRLGLFTAEMIIAGMEKEGGDRIRASLAGLVAGGHVKRVRTAADGPRPIKGLRAVYRAAGYCPSREEIERAAELATAGLERKGKG